MPLQRLFTLTLPQFVISKNVLFHLNIPEGKRSVCRVTSAPKMRRLQTTEAFLPSRSGLCGSDEYGSEGVATRTHSEPITTRHDHPHVVVGGATRWNCVRLNT